MSIKNEPEDFNGFNSSSNSHSHLIEEESLDDDDRVSNNNELDEDGSCSDDTDNEESSNDSDLSSEAEISTNVYAESSEISTVVFPLETIQIISEQNEIKQELTEDAALSISEDVSYRIRELIHCSSQFMRHSFRTKLSTKDIFQAMQELDCDLIFGHNNASTSNNNDMTENENYYVEVPSAGIFVENQNQVDLKKETLKLLKFKPPNKDKNDETKWSLAFDIDWFSLTNPICDNIYYINGKSNLIDNYFRKLTEILLNDSKLPSSKEQNRCLKVFYVDLSKNRLVKSLICPLFYFIRNTIISWEKLKPSNDGIDLIRFNQTRLKSISRLLTVLCSIIRNEEFVNLTFDSKIVEDFTETILMLCFESNSLNLSFTLV
ncbi:transcription initiation factor TFIID subunit 6-like protein, partial [Euroglyphus maynei]